MKSSLIVFVFLLIIAGCSAREIGDEGISGAEQTETVTVARSEGAEVNYIHGLTSLVGTTIFTAEWDFEEDSYVSIETRIIRKRQGDRSGESILTLSGEQILLALLADEDESVYIFYRETLNDNDSYYFRKNDVNGTTIFLEEITFGQDNIGIRAGIIGPYGEVLLCGTEGKAYFFDEQGKLALKTDYEVDESEMPFPDIGLVNAVGAVYLYQLTAMDKFTLRPVDMENKSFGERKDIFVGTNLSLPILLYSGYEKGILLSHNNSLWCFAPETEEQELVLNWNDQHVNLNEANVTDIWLLSDGSFAILYVDYSATYLVLLEDKDSGEIADINSIVIGYFLPEGLSDVTHISDAVRAYNRTNPEYPIEIRKYETELDYQLALIRGEGPDLFDISRYLPRELLAAKGILEDLSPFFAASEVVNESDLLESVRRAGYIGDKLLCVIPDFGVHGYVVEKGVAVNSTLTAEEFFHLADKYPHSSLTGQINPYLLIDVFRFDLPQYINWEEQECYFNSEGFIELLELMKTNVRGSKLFTGWWDATSEHFRNKDIIAFLVLNVSVAVKYWQMKEAFGENVEIIGFPNPDGKPIYKMNINQAYAMNSASKNKEEAWKFLEFLLSEDYQQKIELHVPARASAMEAWRSQYDQVLGEGSKTGGTNFYTKEDITGKIMKLTEDDIEVIRFLIENAYWEESINASPIYNILLEETPYFFDGDKTAKEVADIIQSRVSLYLQE